VCVRVCVCVCVCLCVCECVLTDQRSPLYQLFDLVLSSFFKLLDAESLLLWNVWLVTLLFQLCTQQHHQSANYFTQMSHTSNAQLGLRCFDIVTLASGTESNHQHHHHTTTILRPFFRDHPGEPVPEENRPDAFPAAQPTVSKHWRQLVHSD